MILLPLVLLADIVVLVGAKQADDITMLSLKIEPHSRQKLRLEAKTENLKQI